MNPYAPTRKPLSFLQREAAAKRKREEQQDAWQDPKNAAIRRVRAEMSALYHLSAEAGRIFEMENGPVPPPKACCGAIHPQRAAALAAFTASWSDDPKAPISAIRSEAEIMDTLASETRAALARAEADLAEIEAEYRAEARAEMGLPDPVEATDNKPNHEIYVERIVASIEEDDLLELVLDESAPVLPTRRGPGRPPKVV